jgi:hypothetical protein
MATTGRLCLVIFVCFFKDFNVYLSRDLNQSNLLPFDIRKGRRSYLRYGLLESNPHVVLILLDNFVCILDTIWDDDALKRFILNDMVYIV